jgi:hypothetical protein
MDGGDAARRPGLEFAPFLFQLPGQARIALRRPARFAALGG